MLKICMASPLNSTFNKLHRAVKNEHTGLQPLFCPLHIDKQFYDAFGLPENRPIDEMCKASVLYYTITEQSIPYFVEKTMLQNKYDVIIECLNSEIIIKKHLLTTETFYFKIEAIAIG